MSNDSNSIGILGGTFDPIHLGHTEICRVVKEKYGLDRVDLVPAWLNPFREKSDLQASSSQRLVMVHLASIDTPWLYVNDAEIKRARFIEGPSYTIDTLRDYRAKHPGAELTLIVGADNCEFHLWREFQEFPDHLARIVIVSRPNYESVIDENLENLKNAASNVADIVEKVLSVNIPKSSTNVRISTRAGSIPIDHLHPEVSKFIQKYRLYGWKGDK